MWQKIVNTIKNKYLIATLIVIVWLTFFDRNNFISQLNLGKELNQERKTKQFYLNEINRDSAALYKLSNDTNALEKYAREKYLMKKENEDIYLIIKKSKNQ